MKKQIDFWGKEHKDEWVIFHDESLCKTKKFLYHGFLFVSREEGRSILNKLFEHHSKNKRYEKRVHFTEIRGAGTEKAKIALQWIDLAKNKWLCGEGLKFYVLGIDLSKINQNLYKKYHQDKVYVRFYEIGLRGAIGWFGINPKQVTHLFFDQGKKDVERYNKSISVFPNITKIKPLQNNFLDSKDEMSKLLQLTDVILGTVRKTFTSTGKSCRGQKRCVEIFYEVVIRFNKTTSAYNPQSRYWKKFGMSFFPKHNNVTPKEFISKDLDYHKKSGNLFYCERDTYEEEESKSIQGSLF